MSNKEEENYLDNLLKNVMEPHPVQPRERGTEDVEELPTEELLEDSTDNSTIEMKLEEMEDLNIDDLVMDEPNNEEAVVEENAEPELNLDELLTEEPMIGEPMTEAIAEPELNLDELLTEEPMIEESVTEAIAEPELNLDELLTEEPMIDEPVTEVIVEPELNLDELLKEEPSIEESVVEEPATEEIPDFSMDDLGELEETISEPTQATEQNLDMGDDVLNLDALEKELEEFSSSPEATIENMESENDMDSLLKDMESNDTESELKLDDLDDDTLKEMGLDDPLTSLEGTSEEDDFDDVLSLLNDDDSDLAEINDLLKKSDNKESIQDDMMDLLNQMADDEEKQFSEEKQVKNPSDAEQLQAIVEEAPAEEKAGKAKMAKKKKVDANGAEIEKKLGLFGKMFHALTEEFEPEPTEEELAKEAEEKAAAKQEAKTKKEEEKAAKAEEKKAKAEEKEAAKKAKAEAAAVKKKEKQEAKEAKLAEKRAKEEAERPKKQKRISPKKIVLVTIFAASVLAVVLLFTNYVSQEGSLQRARKAYYEGNYQTVYVEMYGSELEESDAIVQARSKIILKMQRKYDSYVNHLKMGQEVQALNALIEGLRTYDSINLEAEQYGVMAEVDEIKNKIVSVLDANYGLSEAQARELLQNEDEITYTKSLNHIIMGDKSDLVSNSDMMQKAE